MSKPPNNRAPSWLGAVGRAKWRTVLADHPTADPDLLALYCQAHELYLTAVDDVRRNGLTLVSQNGRRFRNPAVSVQNEKVKELMRLSKLLRLDEPKAPASQWEGLLAGGNQ